MSDDTGVRVYETRNNYLGTFYAPEREESRELKIELTHVVFPAAYATALVDVAEATRKRYRGWSELEIDELRAALDRLDAARQQGARS